MMVLQVVLDSITFTLGGVDSYADQYTGVYAGIEPGIPAGPSIANWNNGPSTNINGQLSADGTAWVGGTSNAAATAYIAKYFNPNVTLWWLLGCSQLAAVLPNSTNAALWQTYGGSYNLTATNTVPQNYTIPVGLVVPPGSYASFYITAGASRVYRFWNNPSTSAQARTARGSQPLRRWPPRSRAAAGRGARSTPRRFTPTQA